MSCSRTQHGGGRFRTPDLSLRSPTLYHWATVLPTSLKYHAQDIGHDPPPVTSSYQQFDSFTMTVICLPASPASCTPTFPVGLILFISTSNWQLPLGFNSRNHNISVMFSCLPKDTTLEREDRWKIKKIGSGYWQPVVNSEIAIYNLLYIAIDNR